MDGDLDVTHDNDDQGEHGSHVAGIATANRYIKTEDGFVSALEAVKVQGVAPDAQLITMKVFGKNGGAYESDYMAAMEDAILLGCNVVNLSLGSSNPGNTYNETYQSFLEQLKETDTVVAVAAGNAGTWADGAWNGHLYSDSVSLIWWAPRFLPQFLSRSLCGQCGLHRPVPGRGEPQISTETASQCPFYYHSGWANPGLCASGGPETMAHGTASTSPARLRCVPVATSTSLIRLRTRRMPGGAILIYNNEAGSINMDLSDYTGSAPCVSITQADGALDEGASGSCEE